MRWQGRVLKIRTGAIDTCSRTLPIPPHLTTKDRKVSTKHVDNPYHNINVDIMDDEIINPLPHIIPNKKSPKQPSITKPRPPMCSFMFFRTELQKTSGLPVALVNQRAKATWNEMSEKDKQPYKDMTETDRQRYKRQKTSIQMDVIEQNTQ
jgi:hypothetical protein